MRKAAIVLLTSVAASLVNAATPIAAGASAASVVSAPAGTERFGESVVVLTNGDIVIADSGFDRPGIVDAGAVFVFGADLQEKARLVGSFPYDAVGRVYALGGDAVVVASTGWNDWRGAVTRLDSSVRGQIEVSSTNSLIGTEPGDRVGLKVAIGSDGSYATATDQWNSRRGAVTIAPPAGLSGEVSALNSLVGSAAYGDWVGSGSLMALSSGFAVTSPFWDNGRGAATLLLPGDPVGEVSSTNSFIGGDAFNKIGSGAVVPLPTGGFVVASPDHRGAVTMVTQTHRAGVVGATNSLVGVSNSDAVGLGGVAVSASGAIAVASPLWGGGKGAVTVGLGSAVVGEVGPANSTVGSRTFPTQDRFGQRVVALHDGSFVALGPSWNDSSGIAVRLSPGGVTGEVDAQDGLTGTPGDQVGLDAIALPGGGFVVLSPFWNASRGAATWVSAGGSTGAVNANNSLVGSTAGDLVGFAAAPLPGSDALVVLSPDWNGRRGAATRIDSGFHVGTPSDANSLVGAAPDDLVGRTAVTRSDGSYAIVSYYADEWKGAITWAPPTGGTGTVSAANSLVGSTPYSRLGFTAVGYQGAQVMSDDSLVVQAPGFGPSKGLLAWVEWGTVGAVDAQNSLVGAFAPNDSPFPWSSRLTGDRLVVGMPKDNRVLVTRRGETTPGCAPPSHSLVRNGTFESTSEWRVSGPQLSLSTAADNGACGSVAVVTARSAAGYQQLFQPGIQLQYGRSYVISFRARADRGRDLTLSVLRHTAPFTIYGLSAHRVDLTTDWQEFSISFRTPFDTSIDANPARLRFTFSPFAKPTTRYYLDDVSVREL